MTLPCFFTAENYGHLRIFMFFWNCFKQRVDFYVTLMAENCLKNVSKSPLHKFYEIEKTLLWKLQILILFPYKCYKSQCNSHFLMVTWYKNLSYVVINFTNHMHIVPGITYQVRTGTKIEKQQKQNEKSFVSPTFSFLNAKVVSLLNKFQH